ncbi:hypothetical protein ANN_22053 [Periplaneta americana]|uniref:Uncharacterized protein n=1 Tax=Periplaneta americana TaxID=6978 RepID=A0ABQ8S716_PERAM|nr:hypothetical protein ANN_22053 [Periplaneta americana]
MMETGLILHRIGTDGGLIEGGNEPAGSLKAINPLENTFGAAVATLLPVSSKSHDSMPQPGALTQQRKGVHKTADNVLKRGMDSSLIFTVQVAKSERHYHGWATRAPKVLKTLKERKTDGASRSSYKLFVVSLQKPRCALAAHAASRKKADRAEHGGTARGGVVGKGAYTRGRLRAQLLLNAVNGDRTFPTLPEVRRSGDIQIILYTPVEISRNYDFAIKEEAPANSGSFSVIQSVSKPEQASQTCVPEIDSSVRPHLRQHPKA